MALGNQIRYHRERLRLTLEQLSELSGVDVGTISALENRDSSRSKYGSSIARALGMTLEQLEDESYEGAEERNIGPAADRKGKVPLISWVRAGDFAHAADLLQPGEAFEWIDTGVTVQRHTFALRVEGDSMEPEFSHGSIIVVEPEMEALPGDYVIARNGDNEATFKQLVRDGADLYLKPLNPRYPIKPLGTATIVGVVREAVKRYR